MSWVENFLKINKRGDVYLRSESNAALANDAADLLNAN